MTTCVFILSFLMVAVLVPAISANEFIVGDNKGWSMVLISKLGLRESSFMSEISLVNESIHLHVSKFLDLVVITFLI